jgi:alpha-N-acetylglucosamine transferase
MLLSHLELMSTNQVNHMHHSQQMNAVVGSLSMEPLFPGLCGSTCSTARVRAVRIQCDLPSRYTKLRLWEAEDEFDLILYMDCDTLAIGRVEAALDWFAPNGTAKAPLGAVYDILGNRTTFNAGVLAVRTNRTLFREMMQAAEKEEVAWEGRFAEQVVLFHHLQDLF